MSLSHDKAAHLGLAGLVVLQPLLEPLHLLAGGDIILNPELDDWEILLYVEVDDVILLCLHGQLYNNLKINYMDFIY